MLLSCSCDYERSFEPGEFLYYCGAPEFKPLDTSRAKRCVSCGAKIKVGETCVKYKRYRYPWTDAEARICCGCDLDDSFCDEPTIRMADHYHCEWCGEMYENLTELGFNCLSPGNNMRDALKEYHELTGFNQPKKDVETC